MTNIAQHAFSQRGANTIVLTGVLLIAYYLINPPKPDITGMTWTQTSEQKDWEVSTPETEGFDTDTLMALHQLVALRKSKKVQSVLIARNGKLVFEQYYLVRSTGDGTPMPMYFPSASDTYHQMRSITKTITSTLIGNLIYEGEIESTETPLFDYYDIERYPDADKKRHITLKHALDFNSGLDWKEWGEYNSDAMNMWLSPDPYEYILNKEVAVEPGEQFVYQGAMSVLLGGVIEKVSGMSLREYAEHALFEPLGITSYDWFAHEVTGDYLGSSGLYLRTRDLAKLGQLYLNKGKWGDFRIFGAQWVADSLEAKGKFWPNKSIQYGHNWWFPNIVVNGEKLNIAGMRGSGGQEMFIIPDLNLIFAMTSGAYIGQDETFPFELLVDYVLPSIGINNASYK